MSVENYHVLLIDDDEDDILIIRDMLADVKRVRFQVRWATTYRDGLDYLHHERWNAALVDYDLGMQNGLDLIREAVSQQIKVPMIMVTGRGRYEIDLDAMQAGAADYISKDQLNSSFLERTIRYAVERRRVEEELERRVAERTKELQVQVALFEGLFHAAPDAILLVLADGSIQRANQQAEIVFGYSISELVRMRVEQLLPDRFKEMHAGHRMEYNANPHRRPMGLGLELFGLHKSGHEFPVDVTLSPLNADNQPHIICLVRDLSK